MEKLYDVAIIGGGVIGTGIARELSRFDLKIIVLEKESDFSCGTSKGNSAIIHGGFDPEENTLMARFNAEGNGMFDTLCKELDVPFRRNGSLIIAFDDEQLEHIEMLRQRGINNGIPGLSILSQQQLLEREPLINPDAKGALLSETAGVIDPMLLTISLMESAIKNGCEYKLNFNVLAITKEENSYGIKSDTDVITAKYVINAAGVATDKIHNMVAAPTFKITPRKGQYFLLDAVEGSVTKTTLFPCPTKMGKGILITPAVHGNIFLGPSSDNVDDPEDVSTSDESLEKVRLGVKILIPTMTTRSSIRTFAGMRAEPDTGDFIIAPADAKNAPGFIDVAGIKSPGLSAAPAIALYAVELLKEAGLKAENKANFDPIVTRELLMHQPREIQDKLIKENPLHGRIICRCENVTEADIVNSINREAGATTTDGVKRRCRAGMGRCQGGFCGPKVQKILSRELGVPLEKIELEKKGSYIITGKTK